MGEFTRPPTMSGGEDVGLEGSLGLAVPRDGVVASCSKWRWRPPVMELHFVRGRSLSEFTAAAAAAGAESDAVIMDAAVWSKMPEEMMWEVVRFLPAAKLFQLQLVSRQWRQELTSAQFRKRRRLTELSWQERRLRRFTQLSWREQLQEQEQERVPLVTCVPPPSRDMYGSRRPSSSSSRSDVNCKVLEVDLSFVPTWFWSRFQSRPRVEYSVVAAGHCVVCISNNNQRQHKRQHKLQHKMMGEAFEADRYCVLNPLTRTYIVLPAELPFPPDGWILLTSTSMAIWSKSTPDRAWRLATYDLASGAGACWVCANALDVLPSCRERSWWFPLPDLSGQVEVNPLDAPRHGVEGTHEFQNGMLVAHRGSLYKVSVPHQGAQVAHVPTRLNVLCGGVLCLARAPEGGVEWETMVLLDASSEIERLTGFTCVGAVFFLAAFSVRELVCFQILALNEWPVDNSKPTHFGGGAWLLGLLGFNLDTLQWELVYVKECPNGEAASLTIAPMELCPDFSLSC